MVLYYYIFFVYFTLYQPEIKEKCKYQLKNNFLDSKMSRKVYLSDTEGLQFSPEGNPKKIYSIVKCFANVEVMQSTIALSIWTYKKTWSSRCNFFDNFWKKIQRLDQVQTFEVTKPNGQGLYCLVFSSWNYWS